MTHLTTEEQHVMSGSHLSPGVEPGHVVGVVLVQPDGEEPVRDLVLAGVLKRRDRTQRNSDD